MRIRSIRPEFWSSEDIAEMDWHTRLVFIGLWSYVDDNGVGRDIHRLILASLFPLDADMSESSRRVAAGILTLEEGGQVVRFGVDGKQYLFISAWAKNQRTDNAGKQRFPLPTCDNAIITPLAVPAVGKLAATRGDSLLGEGEKGRRGEGEKHSSPTGVGVDELDRFDEFWDAYDKKEGRKPAEQKWKVALRKRGVTADLLISAAASYVAWQRGEGKHPQFTKHAATWLNGEHWADERTPTSGTVSNIRHLPNAHDLELPPDGLSVDEYAAWDAAQRAKRKASQS